MAVYGWNVTLSTMHSQIEVIPHSLVKVSHSKSNLLQCMNRLMTFQLSTVVTGRKEVRLLLVEKSNSDNLSGVKDLI